jgi:hypothetical protein
MMDIYTSNDNVVLHPLTTAPWLSKQYTHIHLHAITLLATLALARLASTTSPAFPFSSQTNRTASRVSQRPLFAPTKSPFHAGDTRFVTTARFSCTRTHDRQERIHSSQPHRCRHVADRSFSKRTHITSHQSASCSAEL